MSKGPQKRHLIRNAIRTPDGTILVSYSRHDYREYVDEVTGETYMVDGGLDYRRGTINKVPATSMVLYDDQPHEVQREVLTWGTYGKNGDQPLSYKPIALMDTEHLKAVLRECKPCPARRKCMEEELKRRNKGKL